MTKLIHTTKRPSRVVPILPLSKTPEVMEFLRQPNLTQEMVDKFNRQQKEKSIQIQKDDIDKRAEEIKAKEINEHRKKEQLEIIRLERQALSVKKYAAKKYAENPNHHKERKKKECSNPANKNYNTRYKNEPEYRKSHNAVCRQYYREHKEDIKKRNSARYYKRKAEKAKLSSNSSIKNK